MSPFRRVFAQAGVNHPVGYSILLLAASMVVCMLAAVTISIKASNHAIRESERAQCESIQADVDAYVEVPPITRSGINQLRSKRELLQSLGCPRPKD